MPNSNCKGSAMMITQRKTIRDGLNVAEVMKNDGDKFTHKDNL